MSLAQMARTHGPLISLKLGTQLLIVASSPSAASQVLKTHDRILSARYIPQTYRVKFYISHSLPFSFDCSIRWKTLRALCKTELFTTRMLDLQAHLRQDKVVELVGSLFSSRGEVVNLGELVFGTAFNILGNLLFSRDVFSLGDKENSGLKHVFSRFLELGMAPNLADFYPWLGGLDVQGLNKEATGIIKKIYGIWEGLLKERGGGNEKKRDFVDVLQSGGCSEMQIKALCLDMFAAGTDTTTTLVDWTMSELVRNPRVMQKVRDELEQVIESLRLHPPGPLLLPREALDTCEVMDYTVPKGSRVMVNVWAIGRDPKVWENPLTFSPERFLNSSVDYKGNNFEFTPLGAGRRICPGLPLGSRVVELIIASLIHTFDWSLPDGMQPNELNMDERFGLTLVRKHPLLLIPK
ncbi:hypothetical protein AAC387_Pa08g0503 [Persea americana]